MNKFELEAIKHISETSRTVSNTRDTWDISCSYKELVKLEDEMNHSNAEYSGEARRFFQKSLKDLQNSLKEKVLTMIRKEKELLPSLKEVDKEEGTF